MAVEPTESPMERIRAQAEAHLRQWPNGRGVSTPLTVHAFPVRPGPSVHIRVDWLSQTRYYAVELVSPVLESYELEDEHYQVIGTQVLQVRSCSNQRILASRPPDFVGPCDLTWAINLAVQDTKAVHGR